MALRMIGLFASLVTICTGSAIQAQPQTTPAAPAPQRHIPPLEVMDQPYIPVPPEQRRTSPPFNGRGPTPFTSVQANVDANGNNMVGDAANEPSIAVDPTNRQRMVIGWREFETIHSNFREAGWAYTANGGRTWHFPGVIQPGHFRSDPCLDVDALGNFYYDSLTIEVGYACSVFISTNGGVSWDSGHNAWGGDKEWMVVDRTGGVGHGNIYSFWSSDFLPDFTRSTNDGQSFETPTGIPEDPMGGTMAVGPDGELYVAGTGITVAKSTNAKFAGQTPTWTVHHVNLGGYFGYEDGPNPGGLLGQANVGVDVSNNATRANVYVLESIGSASSILDVKFSRSTDGGQTWSPAVRVNDDTNYSANWHWFGTMSVAPNGRIDAVWFDTRNHSGTYLSELFYSYSEDAGQSWAPNVQVSIAFDPHVGWPQQDKIGDYMGMVSFNAGAHVAYPATFNGEQDVYYVYIPRYAKGDVNCDGAVNFGDIDPFVALLSG